MSNRILILAPRQTGKSTAVAVLETIRGFSAPRMIVADEAAFASETVCKALEPMALVSNGTFILLSTPNGQTELETLRKCYRDDFDLFDPEYDLEGKD